ncbi:DNA/RNA polymerase, partial [Rhizopus microsporus var. microsporus]
HTIESENPNATVHTKPYRLIWEEDEHLKQEITDMLNNGLIYPSQGKWTSPVFFIFKKDKGLRLVDFHKLNQNTKKTLITNELLDSFDGATVFSTLDAASGY